MKKTNDNEERDEFLEQAENMTSDQLLKGIYAALLRMEEKLDDVERSSSKIKGILCFFELLLLLSFIVWIVAVVVTAGH